MIKALTSYWHLAPGTLVQLVMKQCDVKATGKLEVEDHELILRGLAGLDTWSILVQSEQNSV